MEKILNITDPFVGNIAGIIIVGMLIANCRNWSKSSRKEYNVQVFLVCLIGIYCLTELTQNLLDGTKSGTIAAMQLILCSLLYFINMLMALGWVRFIAMHLGFTIHKGLRTLLLLPLIAGTAILVLNCYFPLVFSIENNVYRHHFLHVYYLIAAGFYFIVGLAIYGISRNNGGVLKFFPVWLYIIPASIGIILDSISDSSYLGICNAIAAGAVILSLQNELVFRDSLTGLYNHSYFTQVKHKLNKKKNPCISGIMMDLNQFKSINDTFGHAEGDKALIAAANIIRSAAGSYGDAIRYAGDEFIILINTLEEEKILSCIKRIEDGFKAFNEKSNKPYKLSTSMGYAVFNAEVQSVNEFINSIDKNMYMNKEQFYEENPDLRNSRT